MKSLKILLICFLTAAMAGVMAGEIFAGETRTLTTMIIITVKPAETMAAKAPAGLEDLYKTALAQSTQNRFVKIEEPINTPSGIGRYTMSEKL
ncbi:MAG: hypothetical protein Q8N91_02225 [Candidatus Omnitrophota bacterium]|nr:hypothetical protein [Candidatus Omnitrophota bacterium]